MGAVIARTEPFHGDAIGARRNFEVGGALFKRVVPRFERLTVSSAGFPRWPCSATKALRVTTWGEDVVLAELAEQVEDDSLLVQVAGGFVYATPKKRMRARGHAHALPHRFWRAGGQVAGAAG